MEQDFSENIFDKKTNSTKSARSRKVRKSTVLHLWCRFYFYSFWRWFECAMYMFTDHQDDAFSSKHTTIQNRAKRTIMGKLIDYELMQSGGATTWGWCAEVCIEGRLRGVTPEQCWCSVVSMVDCSVKVAQSVGPPLLNALPPGKALMCSPHLHLGGESSSTLANCSLGFFLDLHKSTLKVNYVWCWEYAVKAWDCQIPNIFPSSIL